MRVISGKYSGKKLDSGSDKTIRPTLEKVREAVFNILFDVEGITFIDCYAGTGAMGIEALSRGASNAIFIENNKSSVEILKKNILRCDCRDHSEIRFQSVKGFFTNPTGVFSDFVVIYIDPPYLEKELDDLVESFEKNKLQDKFPDFLLIIESPHKFPMPNDLGKLNLVDKRVYGGTKLSFYRQPVD